MEKETHIKDYAEGWISEREGTDVPTFLKFAFVVIGGGCVSYIFVYMNGDTGHADRGPFVQALNRATTQADGLMTAVGLMAVVYVIAVVFFAFRGKVE
ncbi:MAG: hypothetical protein R2729_01935 [Bryobacteraceae bacterium]